MFQLTSYCQLCVNTVLCSTYSDNGNITRQWLGPGVLTDGPDYTIFNDTLRINQLNVSRDNEQIITCMVVILPLSEYVLQSGTSSVDTQLTVRGKLKHK